MDHTWGDRARQVIGQMLAENKDADEKTLQRALFEAYPFGERKYWPYKVWCAEVRRALGKKSKAVVTDTPMDELWSDKEPDKDDA